MSRFQNLEFEQEPEDQGLQPILIKDEAYYMGEAQRAFESGNFELALRLFSKVLEFNPQNTAAWSSQVRMLIELGEFREAKVWADKALEQFPNDSQLLAAKAVALARIGDLKEALAFSDAAIEERGATPYVWLARADVFLARKEKRADYCMDKAIQLAPSDWIWRWLASRIYAYYRKFALALKMAGQALTFEATQAVIWLELARHQRALGMIPQAQNSYQQVRQLNPTMAEAETALLELQQGGMRQRLSGWWRRFFSS